MGCIPMPETTDQEEGGPQDQTTLSKLEKLQETMDELILKTSLLIEDKKEIPAEFGEAIADRKKPIPQGVPFDRIERIKNNFGSDVSEPLKQFFNAAYLTAGRCSEILAMRRYDVEIRNINKMDMLCCTLKTLKAKPKKGKDGLLHKPPPEHRELQFPLDSGYAKQFAKDLSAWADTLDSKQYLFTLTQNLIMDERNNSSEYKAAYRFCKSIDYESVMCLMFKNGAWVRERIDNFSAGPHFLRHCRVTDLKRKGMDNFHLQLFCGWRSAAMLNTYAHLNATDIGIELQRIEG